MLARFLALSFVALFASDVSAAPYAPIARTVPAQGIKIPEAEKARLAKAAAELRAALPKEETFQNLADIEVLLKAVEYALDLDEFYTEKDIAKADELLKLAGERLKEKEAAAPSWTKQTGLVVRGYRSPIDGSCQPYGLVIPANHDFEKPCPLYIFLHGRGEKTTDMHFLAERLHNAGQIAPPGAIVLHPFGRQCIGWKSAGEVDALEALAHVQQQYKIDPNRIVLMGFSMGGAGTWHIGAHYTDHWCAVAPGAGFSETAQFMKWKPTDYGPAYEQTLWGLYDVPCYTRNLFNVPVVAYSGEKDGQIQAARVMEGAFKAEGRELKHILGPGTEHKYHPESLKEVMSLLGDAVAKGRSPLPEEVHFQTRTLRYSGAGWVHLLGLEEHWKDSRVEAKAVAPDRVEATTKNILFPDRFEVTTKNIRLLQLFPPVSATLPAYTLVIDGQSLSVPGPQSPRIPLLAKTDGKWALTNDGPPSGLHAKIPGRQGPIDDAFMEPFLFVRGTGKCAHPEIQQWVDFELAHQIARWKAVFRGDVRVKNDTDVTPEDIKQYHLVLWGDPQSNSLIAKVLPQLPLTWTEPEVGVTAWKFPAATHVPALVYPNPLTAREPKVRYVVLNSGPTFREAHDKNNSLQNPHLPDWALIDVTTAPNDQWPGKIVAADFFDEHWKVKPSPPQTEKK